MWLLNVDTLQLQGFFGRIPAYAILSHTWGEEEVTFQDIMSKSGDHKSGYAKVKGCCEQAKRDGFKYVWVDTCCIDKSSSAELSEAINSMYSWYKNSTVCYVYISDVPTWHVVEEKNEDDLFFNSRWFTRGWTLQELIAPRYLIFFAADWSEIGTKSSLHSQLAMITKIPSDLLRLARNVTDYNVFTRMSWARGRNVTRIEDKAYSLFGIFGVQLPLLYGERFRAFIRLQEEILRTTDDLSIFAWAHDHADFGYLSGVLATSPSHFVGFPRPPDDYQIPSDLTQHPLSGLDVLHFDTGLTIDPLVSTSRGIRVNISGIHGSGRNISSPNVLLLYTGVYCRNTNDSRLLFLTVSFTKADRSEVYLRNAPNILALAWTSGEELIKQSTVSVYLRSTTPDREPKFFYCNFEIVMNNLAGMDHVLSLFPFPPNSPPGRIYSSIATAKSFSVMQHQGTWIGFRCTPVTCMVCVKVTYQPPVCYCQVVVLPGETSKLMGSEQQLESLLNEALVAEPSDRATWTIATSPENLHPIIIMAAVRLVPDYRSYEPTFRLEVNARSVVEPNHST